MARLLEIALGIRLAWGVQPPSFIGVCTKGRERMSTSLAVGLGRGGVGSLYKTGRVHPLKVSQNWMRPRQGSLAWARANPGAAFLSWVLPLAAFRTCMEVFCVTVQDSAYASSIQLLQLPFNSSSILHFPHMLWLIASYCILLLEFVLLCYIMASHGKAFGDCNGNQACLGGAAPLFCRSLYQRKRTYEHQPGSGTGEGGGGEPL